METQKNKIGLPLIALGLDFLPVLLVYINSLTQGAISFILLLIVALPIAGLITGIVALSQGKGKIGIVGKIIAIIAIALPVIVIALIVIFFIGVATGLISLM